MSELVPHDDVPEDEAALLDYVVGIIERGRRVAAVQVNSTLTMTYWLVGRAIAVNTLRNSRADYGQQIVATLSHQLKARFGSGFDRTNVIRMISFARAFPEQNEVEALTQQLSWSHLRELLSLKSDEARRFYAREAATKHLSVRELRAAMARKAYERREIANSQIPVGSAVPRDTFKDPLILDTLGLHDSYLEKDLEAAILRDVQAFLLEVGNGFAFVSSQKRMVVDGDDFYLDLLFFSRPLRRLVAVELKIGKFDARFEGQMKLYLKWLDRYDRQPHEEAPVGLILCTEVSREQVELLEMHKDGIVVAEYWTALPPKAELEAKLAEIVRDAQERLARREINAAETATTND
jgi:predicted nuclease of restriction endonuclease-like (RecB) superfamily